MRKHRPAIGCVVLLAFLTAGCSGPRRAVVSTDEPRSRPVLPAAKGAQGMPGVTTTQESPFAVETVDEAGKRSRTQEEPVRSEDIAIHEHTIRTEGTPQPPEIPANDNISRSSPDGASPR